MKVPTGALSLQAGPIRRGTMVVRLAGLAALVGAGLWLRTLGPLNLTGATAWPGPGTTIVSLYFSDGPFLFPVSRRMPRGPDLPRLVLEGLLAGPPAASRLTSPVPSGTMLRFVHVVDGVARVDLAGTSESLRDAPAAVPAIVATMTGLPGIQSVALSVEGTPMGEQPIRAPLIYFPSAHGLVASPGPDSGPRAALDAFLAGPPAASLTGMPSDARLLQYDFNRSEGLVSLRFAYTASLRALALRRPDLMRFLLLGLIATLTEFPEVRAVLLDFGGQTRLGLGECSDLLRTPQPRPALLNDERLLR